MARIFVSYSRKNSDFCKRLTSELQKRDLDFWVDWEGIPPTVDWLKEIEKGVEEADTFLAIVSTDWVSSRNCIIELEYAVKNGKRLIPVVAPEAKEIKWDDVPADLAQLNFIFFTEKFDFNTQLDKLFTALDTDYDWLKTHRRLQVKALEWERSNKESGFLLHGRDLEEAEVQVSLHSTTNPIPTAIHREYLLKSRQLSDRQRRATTGVLIFILVILIGISAYFAIPRIFEKIGQANARGEMVVIPQGTAIFGVNNEDSKKGAAVPLQQIPLHAFQIGKYEVTNMQYKLCVKHGTCTVPFDQTNFKDDNFPVVYVTLFQANNYCQWIGQRLPTELEWERAARGPSGDSWPWGNTPSPSPDFVNMPALGDSTPTAGLQLVNSNDLAATQAVTEKIYNLVGNVWEWTSSYIYTGGKYDPAAFWDGKAEDFNGTVFYATRGGGWANQITYVSQFNPNKGSEVRNDLGFRCAVDVK